MRLAVCELPDGLELGSPTWLTFIERVGDLDPDLLVLNEMPLGDWIADRRGPNAAVAERFAKPYDELVKELLSLPWATFGSRPVQRGELLANEAFLVDEGHYRPVHHKQYFPQEAGWYEQDWFAPAINGFDVVDRGNVHIGALLCTELMFNEWARHYRRRGANVIAVPRATGALDTKWRAAGAMAAVVSGCYVASSNRSAHEGTRPSQFGGGGFVFAPSGELLAQTTASEPIAVVEVDLDLVVEAQRAYPSYVPEIG
ncbi:carbon-nitrogen hydrolase family protein [Polaromonas glacialis]|uniref:carbon-nitrogen hydrolase family protein n=1 Tax=Polaromonas glacialis TaxID=866564 RepID=UPI0004963355|nr:carbon-nitrogen hydrolase family protein [Polaromonas glacialis]